MCKVADVLSHLCGAGLVGSRMVGRLYVSVVKRVRETVQVVERSY